MVGGRIDRRQFLGGAAAAAAGLVLVRSPGALAAPPISPRRAYGPDSARSTRLGWATPTDVAGLRVEVGLDETLGSVLPVETRSVTGTGVRYRHVLADGLDAGTTYHYRLRHDGGATTGTFRTAPAAPEPFRFVAFGDQGNGATAAQVNGLDVVRSGPRSRARGRGQLGRVRPLRSGCVCWNARIGSDHGGTRIPRCDLTGHLRH